MLGFCLGRTGPSLWSRRARDKEVRGRTLASLGISFTGVQEAHTLFNRAGNRSHVRRKQLLDCRSRPRRSGSAKQAPARPGSVSAGPEWHTRTEPAPIKTRALSYFKTGLRDFLSISPVASEGFNDTAPGQGFLHPTRVNSERGGGARFVPWPEGGGDRVQIRR